MKVAPLIGRIGVVVIVAGIVVVVPIGLYLFASLTIWLGAELEPAQNWQAPQQNTAGQERWRAALRAGDGDDWLALSDRDQAALCVEAARVLGHDNADTYLEFLDSFYRQGGVRRKKIAETLAVCTALIDRGIIDPEL